ncbi:hypothetical protein PT974_06921 [Cladobotryum mycophilum]|uniref:Rhodopsin domain-containing protein n=1 Tax=Cladobotryum mycophilum TaxID=491253 RepID=A0ABR0SMU9_9HYPO
MPPAPNTSTKPPVLDNPRGQELDIAVSIVLVFMTIVVAMRLWGRYRYKTPAKATKFQYGESRFWILMSDITVVVSYTIAVALTAVCYAGVRWGDGLHTSSLSPRQAHTVLKLFFVYQVLYKFLSGIAKIATLFLLLAISMPQMRGFNLFCKCFALYIGLYCLATSLATVFQCGTAFRSNWNKTLDQSQCFFLPPFWYSHAAINVSATAVMAVLPWWLFASITYKRKHAIATIMSALAVGETVLGAVRLYGLYTSAHSKGDLTYGNITGLLVSQLEVDFACISACVPTVLKMVEEFWCLFCVHVLGIKSMAWNASHDSSGQTPGGRSNGSHTVHSGKIPLSDLRSVDREPRPAGPYSIIDKDEESASMDSSEHIVRRDSGSPSGGITVQTDYSIRIENNDVGTSEATYGASITAIQSNPHIEH